MTHAIAHADDVIANSLEEIAKRRGASMAQVSLAWLMSREGVTAPIIGPNSVAKLEDLLGTWCMRPQCYRVTFSDPWHRCRELGCYSHGGRSKVPGGAVRPYEHCWTQLVAYNEKLYSLHMSSRRECVSYCVEVRNMQQVTISCFLTIHGIRGT